MLKILRRKYPLKTGNWRDALLSSLILFWVLYLLKPFGLDWYDQHVGLLFPVCLGYSMLSFVAIIAYQKSVEQIAKRKKTWTIMNAVLAGIVMWLIMGLVNFGYSVLVLPVNKQHLFLVLFYFVYWTIIIGLLLTFVSVLINYNRYLKSELAVMLNKTSEEQKEIMVNIHDEAVRGEELTILINDFLYAESMKNDMTVWYEHQGKVENRTFRMTVAQLLSQLPYKNIFPCHRSFIVNVNNITNAKGNSNGYQLKMGNATTLVPVSRANVSKLKEFLG